MTPFEFAGVLVVLAEIVAAAAYAWLLERTARRGGGSV